MLCTTPAPTANQTISPGAHATAATVNIAALWASVPTPMHTAVHTDAAARMSSLGPPARHRLSQGVIIGVSVITARACVITAKPNVPADRPCAIISVGITANNPIRAVSVATLDASSNTRRASEKASRYPVLADAARQVSGGRQHNATTPKTAQAAALSENSAGRPSEPASS